MKERTLGGSEGWKAKTSTPIRMSRGPSMPGFHPSPAEATEAPAFTEKLKPNQGAVSKPGQPTKANR